MSSFMKRTGVDYNPPTPPPPPPSKNRRDSSPNRDSDDDDDDSSWEMRCRCEMDHADGDTVECEQCKKWQHMACMGLKMKSDVSKYKCEVCMPRKLPVSKREAVRIQKKVLKKIKTQERKKGGRALQDHNGNQMSSSSSNRTDSDEGTPIPNFLYQMTPAVAVLINSIGQTPGADNLLVTIRRTKKARSMYVTEDKYGFVSIEPIAAREVVHEMTGRVTLPNEMKRQPGYEKFIFLYDGLKKDSNTQVDDGSTNKRIVINTNVRGNEARHIRRSCMPNCVLKHVIGDMSNLGIMITATKDIDRSEELTLPFDCDWKESDVELECALHPDDRRECVIEQRRRSEMEKRVGASSGGSVKVNDDTKPIGVNPQNQPSSSNRQPSGDVAGPSGSSAPPTNWSLFEHCEMIHLMPHINECSPPAYALLLEHLYTIGGDYMLEDSRRNKKAFVSEDLNCLFTSESVPANTILLEINGKVKMAEEEGTGINTFLYTGLQNPIKIEANNDSKYTRRSCKPNSTLKHVIGTGYLLGVFVVSVKDIQKGNEVTLPFDMDDKETPCAEHWNNRELCDRR